MTVALVQSATGSSSTGSATATFGSATTAGNCVVACVGSNAGGTATLKLGSTADNFSQVLTVASSVGATAYLWTDPNCAGGQTAVNARAGSGGVVLAVFEFSGLAGTVDQSSSNGPSGAATTFVSGTTGTTMQAQEAWIGMVAANGSGTITGPSSPWTDTSEIIVSTFGLHFSGMAGYQVPGATGTASYSGTMTSMTYAALVATLLPAGTYVSGTDASSAASESASLALADTDASSGSDGGENVNSGTSTPSDSDSGTGTDAVALLTIPVADTDASNATADSQAVSKPGAQQGKGDGTRTPFAVYDSAGSPPWNLAETGHGTDGGEHVSTSGGAPSDSDASAATADGGESIQATLSDTDASNATADTGLVLPSKGDYGHGTDAGESVTVLKSDSDTGSGHDGK